MGQYHLRIYNRKKRFVRNRTLDSQTAEELVLFKRNVEGRVLTRNEKGGLLEDQETGLGHESRIKNRKFRPAFKIGVRLVEERPFFSGEVVIPRIDTFFPTDTMQKPDSWTLEMQRIRQGEIGKNAPRPSGSRERR